MISAPLTHAQKLIYDLQARGARNLQIALCVNIKGFADPEAFRRAADDVTARHPVMSSLLKLKDGEPVQRLVEQTPSFTLLDITVPSDQQADRLLSAEADAPIDLFRERPFRFVLARAGADEVFFLLVGHHLFTDLAGLRRLLIEYLSLLLGRTLRTSRTSPDGGDRGFFAYAMAEQKMISDGTFARRGRYWASRLSGADPVLHLPGRGPEPQYQSRASTQFKIEGNSYQKFSDRARRMRASNFVLAATAIFHALREVADQDNILLSMVSDARRPPFHQALGNFAGTSYIQQCASDTGVDEKSVQAVRLETIQSIANYVPEVAFFTEVGWMRERLEKRCATTEAHVNYAPVKADISKLFNSPNYEVKYFSLQNRNTASRLPYHGEVIEFRMFPTPNSLSGIIGYEPAIVAPHTAEKIASVMLDDLT